MRFFGLEIRRAGGARTLPAHSYGTGSALRFTLSPRMSVPELMANATVASCVQIISDAVASLSCNVYRRTDGGRETVRDAALPGLLKKWPNEYDSAFTFKQKLMTHLLLRGNAFIFVERAADFQPRALYLLDPDAVEIRYDDAGRLCYEYSTESGTYKYDASTVLHIPAMRYDSLRGWSPLEYATRSAKLGLDLDRYTESAFDGGYHQKILLKVDDDLKKNWKKENSQELIEMFKMSFGGRDRQNDPIVVARADARPLDLPSNTDSQLSENRAFSEKEIAKIFRVPLFMLGSEASKFTNMEQANTHFLQHTLTPWLVKLQSYLDRLITYPLDGDCYVEFDTDSMLRADYKSRMEMYVKGLQSGIYTPNQIFDMENLPRATEPWGDQHFMPVNISTADKIAAQTLGDAKNAGADDKKKDGGEE